METYISLSSACCSNTCCKKEIKWSKRCKDKSLICTTKEIINQVSHSKKWKSEQLTDNFGNPVYDENGKAKLIKSYSLLQDRFFNICLIVVIEDLFVVLKAVPKNI